MNEKIDWIFYSFCDLSSSTNTELETLLAKAEPLLKSLEMVQKVVVLPLPRYVFGGCCADGTHAPNTKDSTFAEHALKEHIRMRSHIKKTLANRGTRNYRVLYFIGTIALDHLTPARKLIELQKQTHTDNVHYTQNVYSQLADRMDKKRQ